MIEDGEEARGIDDLLESHCRALAQAAKLLDGRLSVSILPDVMTPDHPLAKAFGLENATALVDTPSRRRSDRAKRLREDVARMSREGRLVREIAAELGISYNYVVDLRMAQGLGRVR